MRWVGCAVVGVVGDDLVDPHLDTTGTAQVTRQATRLSQSLPHRRKRQARQDCNNGHDAKAFNQRESPSAVLQNSRHYNTWTTQGVDSHAKKSSKAVSTTRQSLGQESRIIASLEHRDRSRQMSYRSRPATRLNDAAPVTHEGQPRRSRTARFS